MAYSSIISKLCKGNCGNYPTVGCQGWCVNCRPDLKQKILDKVKKRNALKKDSGKVRSIAIEVKPPKDYAELDRWFKERQKEMTGHCANCSGKSEKYSKMYKCSVAHLLPKKLFKSVATHPDNWIELCFYGNSCHTNFDNHMIDWLELNCFDTVIKKFAKIYPSIAQDERRHIPPILIEYLKTEI